MFPILTLQPIIAATGALILHAAVSKGKRLDEQLVTDESEPSDADLRTLQKKKLGELLNEMTLEELIALVQKRTVSDMQTVVDRVSENLDAIYTDQIAKAQDFVNGSSSELNIHAVRELLRDLLPERYHPAIKQIKQGQSVKTIINILGGNNQVLPNAEKGICEY